MKPQIMFKRATCCIGVFATKNAACKLTGAVLSICLFAGTSGSFPVLADTLESTGRLNDTNPVHASDRQKTVLSTAPVQQAPFDFNFLESLNKQDLFEWKIRGKYLTGYQAKITLSPIPGIIDTIFYRGYGAAYPWNTVLFKIDQMGEYRLQVNGCCGGFFFKNMTQENRNNEAVCFQLITDSRKLYMGRMGKAGVLLQKNRIMQIDNPCWTDRSAMSSDPMVVTIEEIDTGACEEQCASIEMKDGVAEEDYEPGIVKDPLREPETCIVRHLNCLYTGKSGKIVETYFYCSKRRIKYFSYIPLSGTPLIVVFDATKGRMILK